MFDVGSNRRVYCGFILARITFKILVLPLFGRPKIQKSMCLFLNYIISFLINYIF